MLVLSRKVDQSIEIDGRIKVKIVKIKGNRVTVGIDAPDDVAILRGELTDWLDPAFENRPEPQSEIVLRSIGDREVDSFAFAI